MVRYITGSSSVPVGGFSNLIGSDNNIRKFTIRALEHNDAGNAPPPTSPSQLERDFPRSHTCFNRLDFPVYNSKEEVEGAVQGILNIDFTGFTMD